MQGDKRFISPHWPWIMFVVTISNNSWSVYGSGSSAEIILSIYSGRILSSNQIKICAWVNPRFCHSTKYIQQHVGPNKCNFVMKLIKDFNSCLNTLAAMPWRCIAFWPGNSKHVISCHFGLHINVINKQGRPQSRTKVIASCMYTCIWRGLPTMMELPISAVSALFVIVSRKWMYSVRSFCWL